MKKVISGDELRKKMRDAISLLCGTVKTTLGPKGNNIIVDHSNFSPFITNDGVTIAENIESEDPVINTILELAKEASIKTNEVVGDGTTTTLVLLESIFNKGIEFVNEGINPLILKRDLDKSLEEVIIAINKKSRKPSRKELEYIASVSANDEEIGALINNIYNRVKVKSAINIKESEHDEIVVNYINGYIFETMLASPYFLKNAEIKLDNPYIISINDSLDTIEQIAEVLNIVIKENKSMIIIAKDYNDIVVNEVVSMYLEDNINVILLKSPMYGVKQIDFYEDINAIIEGKQINDISLIESNNLHLVKNIIINNENTIISFDSNKYINDHLNQLNNSLKNCNDLDYLNTRIAMFLNGIAEIIVGAPTKLERREKKMRIDDALCAIDSCKEGILPGSGLTLLEISEELSDESLGNKILKSSLTKPIEQILINAALDLSIIDTIKNNNYKLIYNINRNEYENINNTKIIDPTLVVINSLKNACSIASMLLTTSSLVINEYKNELNKMNDFNEL